jgi:glucose/arabinose dehydrogenase
MDTATGAFGAKPFLDLSGSTSSNPGERNNERGMVSLAFAPDYARSRLLYVFHTDLKGDSRVEQLKASPDGSHVPKSSARTILRVRHSFSKQHFAGGLAFGPDRRLYVSLGDAMNNRWAQRRRLYGQIVSLDPAHPAKTLRVLAKGLRNPYRIAFDSFTGDLLVGDVGETTYEEVDVLDPLRKTIANLGWPFIEGPKRHFKGTIHHLVKPRISYSHKNGTAVVGGVAIRDPRMPELRRRYVYADYCNGWVALARIHRRKPAPRKTGLMLPLVTSIGEDASGRLYLTSRGSGIYRIDPLAPSSAP